MRDVFAIVVVAQTPAFTWEAALAPGDAAQTRIEREVRHEMLTLPNYGVFDDLKYRVDGNSVTLLGYVTRSALQDGAERAVKRIEGVDRSRTRSRCCPFRRKTTASGWGSIRRSMEIRR